MDSNARSNAIRQVNEEYRLFRIRRFRTITIACMVVMGLVIAQFVIGQNWPLVIMESVGFCVLAAALLLQRLGRMDAAIYCMMGTMTATVFGFMWLSEGIHDFSFLVLPSILIVGSILMKREPFLVLLVLMIVGCCAIVWAEIEGIKIVDVKPSNFATIYDVVVVLGITAFAAWILASDMRKAILQATLEATKANLVKAELSFLANHDPLTDLPNRTLVRARVDQAVGLARRSGTQVGLLFIDLDNFKTVNDSLGHSAGDSLLKGIAERLLIVTRDSDTVSRLGGDEFLIVTPEVKDISAIHTIIEKLEACMRAPFSIEGHDVTTSVSIGVAVAPDDGVDFDALLQKADIAMYRAKESGRNTSRLFDQSMNDAVADQLEIRNALTRAVENNEFSVHYQPQISLVDGELIGVEALLRWQNPSLGSVSPFKFIPVAEASGLIVPIGEWVLEEACRQGKEWQDAGLDKFSIAVNLSSVQFRRGNVERLVNDVLAKTQLPAQYLDLELTESVLLDDTDSVLDTTRRLRELGVRMSIDDFGTGYSSMSYLRRFSADTLKIDRSFVHNVTSDSDNAAIVVAIIQLAHGLGLRTVAEGVEDQATLEFLRANGCDEIQGYLIAKPMPAQELPAWIAGRDK